jgi:hypothetical protein
VVAARELGYALLVFAKGDERSVIGRVHVNNVVRGVFQNAYLLEKLAFRREGMAKRYLQIAGQWQDHAIFAVPREGWRAV